METELFLSVVQTIEQRGGRDVGQVPASARLSGAARISENAKDQEAEADGTRRRDIHTAITVLGGGRNEQDDNIYL